MTRLAIYVVAALFTFAIGVSSWLLNPFERMKPVPNEPLRVSMSLDGRTIDRTTYVSRYIITVQNVSTKTVRGYSLGFTCNCRSWDSWDKPYPWGINFTNPNPQHQVLRPGEAQEVPMVFQGLIGSELEPKVWVDLVHFQGEGNWGPNQSHKEGYVRE